MKKVISTRDFSAIKKMAQIVNPLVSKKVSLLKKMESLSQEVEALNAQIEGMEAGIKVRFLGLGTEQLVRKVVSPAVKEDGTPSLDAKTGKQLTKTTWEPLECLQYDSEKNNYILTIDEPVENNIAVIEEITTTEDDLNITENVENTTEDVNIDNPFNF